MEWLENHHILLWHRRTQLDQVYSPNYEWSHNTNRCVYVRRSGGAADIYYQTTVDHTH